MTNQTPTLKQNSVLYIVSIDELSGMHPYVQDFECCNRYATKLV